MADPFVQQQFFAAIGAGASLSAQIDIGGWTLVGVVVPAGWSTAPVTFQASADGGTTWGELINIGASPIEVPGVTAGQFIALDPAQWRAVRSLKVRSGAAGSPVNQASGVTLTLLCRAVF